MRRRMVALEWQWQQPQWERRMHVQGACGQEAVIDKAKGKTVQPEETDLIQTGMRQ